MKRIVLLSFVLMFLAVACGKDENPTAPEEKPPVPQVTMVHGPTSPNVPPLVAGTVNAFAALGALAQDYASAIQSVTPTRSGEAYVRNYSTGQAAYTVSASESSQGINWQVKVTGTYDDQQVTDFLALKGFSAADGKSGWWESYDPRTRQKALRYEWTTDAKDVVQATFIVYGDPVMKYEVVNNPDGSGSLEYYEASVKKLEATWQANGSGSYVLYDENGNIVGQGSWT